MFFQLFALAHEAFGISHFTTDLILVVSFAMIALLPISLLRPHIQESEVKTKVI